MSIARNLSSPCLWFGKNTVIPRSLIEGEEGPDFYAVEDFLWILEEFLANEAA